jgi:hypothetical protein
LANDRSGEGTAQHQLTLLGALPCQLGAPAQQNFTQVTDSSIDCCGQVDLTIIAIITIIDAIVTETDYFGAHSVPRESLCRQDEHQQLTSYDLAERQSGRGLRESALTAYACTLVIAAFKR